MTSHDYLVLGMSFVWLVTNFVGAAFTVRRVLLLRVHPSKEHGMLSHDGFSLRYGVTQFWHSSFGHFLWLALCIVALGVSAWHLFEAVVGTFSTVANHETDIFLHSSVVILVVRELYVRIISDVQSASRTKRRR